jgi:hypothetical protein
LCKKKRLGYEEEDNAMNTKMIVQRVKPMRQTVRLLLLVAVIDCIGATTNRIRGQTVTLDFLVFVLFIPHRLL